MLRTQCESSQCESQFNCLVNRVYSSEGLRGARSYRRIIKIVTMVFLHELASDAKVDDLLKLMVSWTWSTEIARIMPDMHQTAW